MNDSDLLITFPVKKASQNKRICEIELGESKAYKKVLKTIEMAYAKSPFFSDVFPIIERSVLTPSESIADFAANSVIEICNYLGLKREFKFSSLNFEDTKGLEKADRLIEICRQLTVHKYINAIGGQELYDKPYFEERGVQLHFIEPKLNPYPQNSSSFIPGLSIIDIIMNNSIEHTIEMLSNYQLK